MLCSSAPSRAVADAPASRHYRVESDASGMIEVGYRCGPRAHRDPQGRCVLNVRPFYGPGPAVYGPRFYGRERFDRTCTDR
ncbi:hypothetical protein CIW48_15655 [Methylobacterium sp. P1-11]|uniref:hypothetical protein n=1 Tax=Methylobacterium sp. P1-11 TaxID=2024616 RepID=UPI0011EE9B5D|nr:hypothetical protein [Methylobacterium sp. P1-11]KAA0122875.1 hypothetical protein CIW48_15655 [Methylobacterium sp. P1-11]